MGKVLKGRAGGVMEVQGPFAQHSGRKGREGKGR